MLAAIGHLGKAFLPFLVVIPSGLRPHLLPAHRQHLAQELQMLS